MSTCCWPNMREAVRSRITCCRLPKAIAFRQTAATSLVTALESFVRMYEHHAAIEDTVVFPAWKASLGEQNSTSSARSLKRSKRSTLATIRFRRRARADGGDRSESWSDKSRHVYRARTAANKTFRIKAHLLFCAQVRQCALTDTNNNSDGGPHASQAPQTLNLSILKEPK